MNSELILIGDELLYGKTRDLNAFWLGPFLKDHGMSLERVTIVRDSLKEIHAALSESLARVDLVFTSGGLGPTGDDLTKEALATFFKKELFESEEAKEIVKRNYARFNRVWKPEQNNYHIVPRDFLVTSNPQGQAPGLAYMENGKGVFAGPGVPREFKALVEKIYFPHIEKFFQGRIEKAHSKLSLRTYGVPEEIIFFELCPGLWEKLEKIGKVSSLPLSNYGGVDIIVQVEKEKEKQGLQEFKRLVENSPLAKHIWQWGSKELPEYVIEKALEKKLKFAFAESCSGGLSSSRITDIAGSSEAFKGSVVCYDEEIKKNLLQVKEETLKNYTVYSSECAEEMAKGVRALLNVDIAISLTGIAGPTGGTEKNPVGTVYIGWSHHKGSGAERFDLRGDRVTLKERFSQRGLLTLLRELTSF